MTDFYTSSNDPATSSDLDSSVIRAEYDAIEAGFAKVAAYTGAANRVVHINSGATAQTTTSGFTFDGTTLTLPTLVGSSTTDATSTTTGAFKTAGGLGVVKALWVGGLVNIAGASVTLSAASGGTGEFYIARDTTASGLAAYRLGTDASANRGNITYYGSTVATRGSQMWIGTEATEPLVFKYNDSEVFRIASGTQLTLVDGVNIAVNTSTGTKIGTATTQKLGFWNATPVQQQAGIVDADGTLADITTKFNSLLSKMETYGLLAVA